MFTQCYTSYLATFYDIHGDIAEADYEINDCTSLAEAKRYATAEAYHKGYARFTLKEVE